MRVKVDDTDAEQQRESIASVVSALESMSCVTQALLKYAARTGGDAAIERITADALDIAQKTKFMGPAGADKVFIKEVCESAKSPKE